MLFVHILHPKIDKDEAEADRSPAMRPESRRLVTLVIAVLCWPFFEQFLGNDSCVGETIHAAFDTHEYETIIIRFLVELVTFDDVLWESFYLHA